MNIRIRLINACLEFQKLNDDIVIMSFGLGFQKRFTFQKYVSGLGTHRSLSFGWLVFWRYKLARMSRERSQS